MSASGHRAASVAPLFDSSRLSLARRLAGVRKNELATEIGKSAAAIGAWELGNKRPTSDSIAALSLALGVEPSFFLGGIPSNMRSGSAPHFRSLRSTSQSARDQAEAYAEIVSDTCWAFERHVEFPEVDVPVIPVGMNSSDEEPKLAANTIRDAWGLGLDPIKHAIRTLENHGVLIVFGPIEGARTIDAYSVNNKLRPIVVLNPSKHDYYRQRFDVVHELGHLVMHIDSEPGSRIVESQAHRFAAEFLMPAQVFSDLLPCSIDSGGWKVLKELKETWGVSVQALLMRARDLGTINDGAYRNATIMLNKWGWRRSEPGAVTILEQPSLLPSAVEQLIEAGMDERFLCGNGRIPLNIFRQMVSRIPNSSFIDSDDTQEGTVVSLFGGETDSYMVPNRGNDFKGGEKSGQ